MCMNIYVCTLVTRRKTKRRELIVFVHRLVKLDANRSNVRLRKFIFDYCRKGSKLYRGRTRPKFIIFLWVKVIECTHIRVRPIDTNYRRLIISFDKSIRRVSSVVELSISNQQQIQFTTITA